MASFRRNVITLITGSTMAQLFGLAIGPLLTRLYTPAEFGVLATYMALVLVMLSLSTGKYELAIVIPEQDVVARDTARLAMLWALGATLLVAILSLVLSRGSLRGPWDTLPDAVLLLLPVSILAGSLILTLSQWLIRKGRFRALAATRIAQSVVTGSAQLLGALFVSAHGLIIGALVGQFCALLVAVRGGGDVRHHPTSEGFAGVRRQARRYIKFPLYQLPSGLLETLSAQLPIFALGTVYGASYAGFYSLGERLIRLPIGLIGQSVGDVFRQTASESYRRTGSAREPFVSLLIKLSLGSIVPAVLFAIVAPALFAFVFGEEWRTAGEYARILTPMFWLSFVTSPLSLLFYIAERQEADFALQVALLASSAAALYIGYRTFRTPEASLILFSGVYCVKYVIELALAYRFSLSPAARARREAGGQ